MYKKSNLRKYSSNISNDLKSKFFKEELNLIKEAFNIFADDNGLIDIMYIHTKLIEIIELINTKREESNKSLYFTFEIVDNIVKNFKFTKEFSSHIKLNFKSFVEYMYIYLGKNLPNYKILSLYSNFTEDNSPFSFITKSSFENYLSIIDYKDKYKCDLDYIFKFYGKNRSYLDYNDFKDLFINNFNL